MIRTVFALRESPCDVRYFSVFGIGLSPYLGLPSGGHAPDKHTNVDARTGAVDEDDMRWDVVKCAV